MYTLSSANVDTCLGVSRGVIPPPGGRPKPGSPRRSPRWSTGRGVAGAVGHSGCRGGLSVASIYCNLIPRY